MSKTLEQVRKVIEASGQSRYSIWKATGIPQQQLSRVMLGQGGISMKATERLLEHLGFEIIVQKKRGRK